MNNIVTVFIYYPKGVVKVKKRIFLIIIGFWCLKLSINLFTSFDVFTLEMVLQKLIFNPFRWFGAIILFVVGFLAIARVIKVICEQISKDKSVKKEWLWIIVLCMLFTYVSFESLLAALLAVGFSLFYGIMDANIRQKRRYYNS